MHEDLVNATVKLDLEKEVKVKKSDITKLEKKLDRLKEMYVEGDLSKQQYVDKKDKITGQINDLKRQLVNAQKIKIDDNALNVYWKLSPKKKAVFWRSLIKKVTVFKGYITVEYLGD